jgi:hypothetical protein
MPFRRRLVTLLEVIHVLHDDLRIANLATVDRAPVRHHLGTRRARRAATNQIGN